MSNIRVSYAEIEQSAAQLGQGRDEIESKLQALYHQIQQLVSSGFVTDQASGRFAAVYAEYTASARALIANLGEIQQFLLQTSQAIREMDSQLAARLA